MGDKIKIIAGILFALAFISLMGVILSQVNRYGENTAQGISLNSHNSVLSELAPYNEQLVSGDTVIQFINNHTLLSSGQKMIVMVVNSEPGSNSSVSNERLFGYCPSSGSAGLYKDSINGVNMYSSYYGSSGNTDVHRNYNKSTSTFKIATTGEYKGHLIYNKASTGVVGVLFVKQ